MVEWFDSHCHLDDAAFDGDRGEVLRRAEAAGVRRMVTIGCARDLESLTAAVDLAVWGKIQIAATVGVHPHDASRFDDAFADGVERAARDPRVCAVGETGLDYHYNHSSREQQRDAFARQIAIARAVGKPIVVHTRNAPRETLELLRSERASDVGGIIHCFSEDEPFARDALGLGFVASFSGMATFKRAAAIQEAAKHQPLDALLVETDAPYLAPVPMRGKRNEPAWVSHTGRAIAELRGMDVETLARATTDNACRVFGWSGLGPFEASG